MLLTAIITLPITIVIPASSSSGLEVTARTDKITYILRETVKIYGNVTYNGQNVTEGFVSIQIKDPSDNNILFRTIPVGSIPSRRWGVEIISAYPCDETGNPKTKFEKGKWAYFKMTAENHEVVSQEVLMTITVFDNDFTPIGIAESKITIDPGETATYMPAIWIDYWVSTGTAFVYFNIYTEYPENDGYPYCPEKMANFTIIESQYEEPPPTPPPEQPLQNGSYQTQFTLSSEPLPGIYIVEVCAWYNGWRSHTITTFQVEDVEAQPRASFVFSPPIASPGQTITFDASYSSPEGYGDAITSYEWDFGDGMQATGKIVTHSYSQQGNYTVTLNVTDSEGFWDVEIKIVTVTTVHDIAVLKIECLDEVYNDWLTKIEVIVKNKGTYSETFNLTAYCNESIIDTVTITDLEPFQEKKVTIVWNTEELAPLSNYTVWVEASLIPGESNVNDNQLTYGMVRIKLLGDVIFDRCIEISDVVKVARAYDLTEDSPNWDPQTDLIPDGLIDIGDIVIVASRYDMTY